MEQSPPYEKKVVETAHKNNVPYTLHICSNIESILELLLQSGADAFELDCKTGVQKAFDVFKNDTCFIGNIDPSGVIAMGTPDLVEQKTMELLEVFSKTNRFILNAGCAIPSNTPEENLKRLISVARNFR